MHKQRPTVGILLFDDGEVLDFCGPFEVFSTARLVDADKQGDEHGLFRVCTIAEQDRILSCRGNLLVQPHTTIQMSPEIALYERELCWLLEHMRASVDALTERQLHWHPAQAQTNSAAAIINHMLESTRVYVLGFGCRLPVSRDRSTEFAHVNASRSSSSSALSQLADDIQTALAVLQPEVLDERPVPPQELWSGTVAVREITRREAFIISIRHAALHLGELRLTSDLARHLA